jgi:murein DD-endopeptidase MepM/ murein hydrolase activator NlpD
MNGVQPIDQGAIMASGMSLVPDYAQQELQRRLVAIQEQEAQGRVMQVAAAAAKQRSEMMRQQDFESAYEEARASANPGALADLAMRFPEFSEAMKRGFDMQDSARKTVDLRQMAEIQSAAQNGRYDLAASAYRRRLEADAAAGGETDEIEQAILDGLQSGDPAQQRHALASLTAGLAAITGEAHFSSTLERLNQERRGKTREIDGVVYDDDPLSPGYGKPVYASQRPEIVSAPNGAFMERVPFQVGDGQSAPAAPPSTSAPSATSGWTVLSVPGDPRDGGSRTHAGWDIAPASGDGGWRPQQPFRIENPRNGGKRAGLTADVVLADGRRLTLMHLRKLPKAGSYQAGELAAIAGQTGNAKNTPPHFHTEARDANGNPIDPRPIFGIGATAAAPVRVRSAQEYERLPKGAQFYDPQGNLRTKS